MTDDHRPAGSDRRLRGASPSVGVVVIDRDSRVIFGAGMPDVSAAPVPWAGRSIGDAFGEAARQVWDEPTRLALAGTECTFEWTPSAAEPLTVRIAPLREIERDVRLAVAICAGSPRGSVGWAEDDAGAVYRAVTANLPRIAVTAFDSDLRFRVAYGEALRLNGWTSEMMEGRTPRELMPAALADRVEPLFEGALRGEHGSTELPSLHDGGTLELFVAPVHANRVIAGVAISIDVTERKRREDETRRLAAIVNQSADAIIAIDPDGLITAWSRGAQLLLGPAAREMTGRSVTAILPRARHAETRDIAARVLAGEVMNYESELLRADGTAVAVAVTTSPIYEEAGDVSAVSMIARDITERKRLEQRLDRLATHDPLTGLLNRRAFDQELGRAVGLARRHDAPMALLLLDIDHFKYINDNYGHSAGDAVLAHVASVLRSRLRETDVVTRPGGDEFALILPNTLSAQARALAAELLEELRRAELPSSAHGVRITASIGIAVTSPSTALDPDELLARADVSLYEAKEAGRNRSAESVVSDLRETAFIARMNWVERLRDAVDHDRFVLYSQPIVDLRTGAADRAELLLRLRDDHDALIAPDAFLPIAERFHLIEAIDHWVVERGLELLRRTVQPAILHINLSATTLADPEAVGAISTLIATQAGAPGRLAFEITETAAITNMASARLLATDLAALGCQLVLDDFGSGFASFSYLKHLPFDAIKIDGDFVRNMTTSTPDDLAVKAIVQMAAGLEKTVIAESIEDQATLQLVRDLGVHHRQGYYLGRPAPTG